MPSIPTVWLNSVGSWSLDGRWCVARVLSTHASHTYSSAASITSLVAPCARRCSLSCCGVGCPWFLCSFTRVCLVVSESFLKHGPWMGVGGGAHPSHISWDIFEIESWSSIARIIEDLGSALGISGSREFGSSSRSMVGVWCQKIVMVSLPGKHLRIRSALRSFGHSSIPKSKIFNDDRCNNTVWRKGASWGSGLFTGNWNRSVPRHTKRHRIESCGNSVCDCWKKASWCSILKLPTLGAIRLASVNIFFHDSSCVWSMAFASLAGMPIAVSAAIRSRLNLRGASMLGAGLLDSEGGTSLTSLRARLLDGSSGSSKSIASWVRTT